MKQNKHITWSALTALLLVTPTFAQGGGPMVPTAPGGGMPGIPGPMMPGGNGPGPQMMRFEFAVGAVQAVNAANRTLTVKSSFGGAVMIVKVPAQVSIVTQQATTIADLKVGDLVQIQGAASGIAASSLTVGQPPAPGGGRSAGAGMPSPAAFAGMMPSVAMESMAPQVQARGRVSALQPLTLGFGNGGSLIVTVKPDARVMRITTMTLAEVKAGDQVQATGPLGQDGVLTADSISVNFGPIGGAVGGGMGMPMR